MHRRTSALLLYSLFAATVMISLFLMIKPNPDIQEKRKWTPSDATQEMDEPTLQTQVSALSNSKPELRGEIRSLEDLWFSEVNASIQKLADLSLSTTGHCDTSLLSSPDLKTYIMEDMGPTQWVDTETGSENQIATRQHIEEAGLFFREGGRYVQVLAKWQRNDPPSYIITAEEFSNEKLEGHPKKYPIETTEEPQTLESVREIFAKLQKRHVQANLYQALSTAQNGALRSLRLMNKIPIEYQRKGTHCSIDFAAKEHVCHCSF